MEKALLTKVLRPRGAAAGGLLLGVCCIAACGSAGAKKPTAILSNSVDNEAAFRAIVADWGRSSRKERIALAPRLEAFRVANPKDELCRSAEMFLAWIELEKGALAAAQAGAVRVQHTAGPGTTADVARTIQGAAMRRQGRAAEALALLSPLVSKLIDGYARALLNEEIVQSALDARSWQKALELMSVWLREAGPEERLSVRARIEENLQRVPADELVKMLDRARGIELALAAEEELEIRKLMARRLASVAKEKRDAELAHHLLGNSAALLGDDGDAIAALAAGASKARVEARTVGLLLSLRDDKTRRRAAEIAAGAVFGLGLPGSAARLVSRDDGGKAGQINDALAGLSGDGASVVIAGTDREESTIVARFAEAHQLPVLLLRPPAEPVDPATSRYTFVVGPKGAEVEESLVAALAARGATPIAVLTDDPKGPRPHRPDVALRDCAEPVAGWKPLGLGGVVLRGEPSCAREAIVAGGILKIRFAGGFDVGAAPLPAGSVVPTAGLFPIVGSPPAIEGWLKAHRGPPTFWSALGRDAAVLAWASVGDLPAKGTTEPKEVAARHAQAAAKLATAQAELWTTEARGFAGGRVLARSLGVRELDGRERGPDKP